MPSNDKLVINIDGVQLKISNLEKIFYPATGFSKGAMIDYYIRIAPVLLPHLAGRPLTMKRYPHGALGKFFYQKQCPVSHPKWLQTAPIWSESNKRNIHFCLLDTLPSLVWAANLAALELHTSLALAKNFLCPTMLVFDLDPGAPATIIECAEVALLLQSFFNHTGLKSFPKTSGSKGLQVYIPLNTPTSYEQTKKFAHTLAQAMEAYYPAKIVSKMKKSLRPGKVLIDWSQNDEHKTTVCVYSLRAREHPTVSTPVTWEELQTAWQAKNETALSFTFDQVLERVSTQGDLFASVLTLQQELPNLPRDLTSRLRQLFGCQ